MFAIIRSTVNLLRKSTIQPNISAGFHILSKPLPILANVQLLTPTTTYFIQNCGFKVMGKVRRRCKDCMMVKRENRWFILCKTHPRHKQMSVVKDPKNTWLLSHATQGKLRPW